MRDPPNSPRAGLDLRCKDPLDPRLRERAHADEPLGVEGIDDFAQDLVADCLLYTSPSPRDT